jgi:hypothetical protein
VGESTAESRVLEQVPETESKMLLILLKRFFLPRHLGLVLRGRIVLLPKATELRLCRA